MHRYFKFIWLFIFSYNISGLHGEIYKEECRVWKNVTDLVEQEPRLNVTCEVNRDCTGFDCNGYYTYNGVITGHEDVVRYLCFGVFLHPCHDPQDMTIYIEVWEASAYNVSYVRDIHSDHKEDIPGVTEQVSYRGTSFVRMTVEADVEYDIVHHNGKKYAKIKMELQPEIHLLFLTERPGEAQVTMVPEVEVPIPRCDTVVREITHTAYQCPKLNTTQYKPPARQSYLPGTSCVINTLGECGDKQKCFPKRSTSQSVCVCITGYVYNNETSVCELQDHAPTSIPIFDDGLTAKPTTKHSSKHSSSSSSKHIFAIVGSVGAVFIVAILALFVIFKYRRHQRRFRANEDQEHIMADNEDVDPIAL